MQENKMQILQEKKPFSSQWNEAQGLWWEFTSPVKSTLTVFIVIEPKNMAIV